MKYNLTETAVYRAMKKALKDVEFNVENLIVRKANIPPIRLLRLNSAKTEESVPPNKIWELLYGRIYHITGLTTIYSILNERESISPQNWTVAAATGTGTHILDLSTMRKPFIPEKWKIKKSGGNAVTLFEAFYFEHDK